MSVKFDFQTSILKYEHVETSLKAHSHGCSLLRFFWTQLKFCFHELGFSNFPQTSVSDTFSADACVIAAVWTSLYDNITTVFVSEIHLK